eukprot:1133972-Pelagomonas_calceolata.AAC.5
MDAQADVGLPGSLGTSSGAIVNYGCGCHYAKPAQQKRWLARLGLRRGRPAGADCQGGRASRSCCCAGAQVSVVRAEVVV